MQKKKKCPTLKIIRTSCVKINNKQMNSIKNKMYTFSFQSHLVIWTAHAYSFMMLFLTSSNYTEKKPTILNMQNPILNKKSSRPMLKKYDLFIIIIKHEKLCGYNFTTSKVWNGRLQGLTHPFAFCSLSTSLTIVTPWNYKGKPRVHGKILLYLNGIHSTFNFRIK